MREVEILHDQLLGFFDQFAENEPINPRDILVMAPDINEYAPFIRAVFDADSSTAKNLPYSISDQSIKESSTYIGSFFEILSLFKSRFNSMDVFGILRTEPVKKRFNINDHELSTLERWIHENRICWGIDRKHKEKINLPDYDENTWRSGLDRLMLGYATFGNNKLLFKNILPYNNMEGNNTKILGNFLDYTESLFAHVDTLLQKHTLAGWSEILINMKEKFMLADDSSVIDDRLLNQSLNYLKELQSQTAFNTLISIEVVQSYLRNILEQRYSTIAGGAGFLTGGITFCSMLPMRAIPFKIICLLGMNDGLYPRSGRKRSFDLMALEPQRGDRSRRYDDRYLFLETILSAREKLYISFVGQSILDGSKKPPSVLVSELMDYIEHGYVIENQESPNDDIVNYLTTMHRLQPFHHDYFNQQDTINKEKLFSYSSENYAAASALSSEHHKEFPLFTSALSTPSDTYRQVKLSELIKFFSHPTRYLLIKRIGITFIEEAQNLNTNEPFSIKGLEKHILENDILEVLMEDQDCEKLYKITRAEGMLPHGKIGKIQFNQSVSVVHSFKRNLDRLFLLKEPQSQKINLDVAGFNISGRLDNLTEAGLVQYRYATLKPKDLIRGWVSHLALNSINNDEMNGSGTNTILAGKDKTLMFLPASESRIYLEQLLTLYWKGLSESLHFFPRTSFVFAREIHKGKNEQEALFKAENEWEGNAYNKNSEKNDPYNSLCFKKIDLEDTPFKEQAKMIWLPIFEHQTRYSN
jgi:exodeoxyribonuclease V gamma subunit